MVLHVRASAQDGWNSNLDQFVVGIGVLARLLLLVLLLQPELIHESFALDFGLTRRRRFLPVQIAAPQLLHIFQQSSTRHLHREYSWLLGHHGSRATVVVPR